MVAISSLELSSLFDFVFLEEETGSTNEDLKNLIKQSPKPLTSFKSVERQTSGRGSKGKKWENADKSMLFTLGVPLKLPVGHYQGITLTLGFEIVRVLQKHNMGVQLKWPNDLWYKNGKLGGILVEVAYSKDKTPHLIVGVGINLICRSSKIPCTSEYKASDLSDWYADFDRDTLIIELAKAIKQCIETFDKSSLELLMLKWKDIDCFYKQTMRYTPVTGESFTVVNEGIDQYGRLRLRKGDTTMYVLDGVIRPIKKDI